MKNKKVLYSTKWITYTAILTALVAATGYIPAIATPIGRIYWVDGMVLIAAYLTDPLSAFIAGGLGSLIYDIFASPAMMIPSLLIHGVQGATVSALLHFVLPSFFKKTEWIKALVFSIAGALIVIFGYFIYRAITSGVHYAFTQIPRNVLQEAIGISAAIVLCYATTLKKRLANARLLPDFKNEMLQNSAAEPEKSANRAEF